MGNGINLRDYITTNNMALTEREIDDLLIKVLSIAMDIRSEDKQLSEAISEIEAEDVLARVYAEGYRKAVEHTMSKRSG